MSVPQGLIKRLKVRRYVSPATRGFIAVPAQPLALHAQQASLYMLIEQFALSVRLGRSARQVTRFVLSAPLAHSAPLELRLARYVRREHISRRPARQLAQFAQLVLLKYQLDRPLAGDVHRALTVTLER